MGKKKSISKAFKTNFLLMGVWHKKKKSDLGCHFVFTGNIIIYQSLDHVILWKRKKKQILIVHESMICKKNLTYRHFVIFLMYGFIVLCCKLALTFFFFLFFSLRRGKVNACIYVWSRKASQLSITCNTHIHTRKTVNTLWEPLTILLKIKSLYFLLLLLFLIF